MGRGAPKKARFGLLALAVVTSLGSAEVRAGERTIRALSYNVWGLPQPILKQGSRLKDIARTIPRLGADIIAFQEAFTGKAKILAQLPQYPYRVWGNPAKGLRIKSGLLLISRWPIVEARNILYDQCQGFDCWARKGATYARVRFPDIGDVNVYLTHTNAEGKDSLRTSQVVQLVNLIRETAGDRPVIVMGDMNYDPKSEPDRALRYWTDTLDGHAIYAADHPELLPLERDAFTYDFRRNKHIYDPKKKPKRIDFLYYLDQPGQRVDVLSSKLAYDAPVGGRFLSDHFGVLMDLVVQGP